MVKVHFESIKTILAEKLQEASESLKVAVAWLNDPILFEILFEKAKTIPVQLLVVNDRLNNTSGNDFNGFVQSDYGELYLAEASKLMHHKFAIIDNKYVVTGSYNWTRGARNNRENIIFTDSLDVVNEFTAEFDKLIDVHAYGPKVTDYQKSKQIEVDAVQAEINAELPIEEMIRHFLLPYDVGVVTRNDPFSIALYKNDRLPITRREITYNTADPKQRSIKFEIRKRLSSKITEVGDFTLEFTQECPTADTAKAKVFFSVSSNGELQIECEEIGGTGKSVPVTYDLKLMEN